MLRSLSSRLLFAAAVAFAGIGLLATADPTIAAGRQSVILHLLNAGSGIFIVTYLLLLALAAIAAIGATTSEGH